MKDMHPIQKDSPAWLFFVKLSFVLAVGATSLGIIFLPVDWWIKGYIGIGLYFAVASTLMLSKTIRDEHEANKLINRISDARTEKILKEFDITA